MLDRIFALSLLAVAVEALTLMPPVLPNSFVTLDVVLNGQKMFLAVDRSAGA